MQLCDVCGEGRFHPVISKEAAEYKGIHGQFFVHYLVCDVCKTEIVDAADALKNKREWVRFKKFVDHIPLGTEIAEMRKRHHLSQSQAANIFGGGPVAFSKYENDDLIPDEAMISLLKLAIAFPETVLRLAQLKKIELPHQKTLLDRVQFEIAGTHWLEVLFTSDAQKDSNVFAKHLRNYHKLTVHKGTSKKSGQTISKSSGELVKKISHGGFAWTLQ